MDKQFISFEIAVKLKELGFNEPCLASWCYKTRKMIPTLYGCGALLFDVDGLPDNENYSDIICVAPLYQQVIDWLRTDKKIFVTVTLDTNQWNGRVSYSADVISIDKSNVGTRLLDGFTIYDNYQGALQEGVEETLTLLDPDL